MTATKDEVSGKPTSKDASKQKLLPKRFRSGCADWHMSSKAVSIAVADVYRMTDGECLDYMVKARFGSWDAVSCPHCGSISRHYWRARESRWKCKGCDKTFSITSGTLFAHRKKSLRQIIADTLLWANAAPGQPALELKRHGRTKYSTAFVHQHKLREGILRGYNVGLLSGDLEMDGAYQSGYRADVKRGRPQVSQPVSDKTDVKKLEEKTFTQVGQRKHRRRKPEGVIDPVTGRRMDKNKRVLFVLRKRNATKGKGAVATRVAVGLVEDSAVAKAVMASFVARGESFLNTDTSSAYTELGKSFRGHRTVEHSKMLVGPNGENNNQAEELNFRYDRAEKGTHLNIEAKYMLEYAVETAFRGDTRRVPNGRQLQLALNLAMSVGESLFWVGFTHGRHRPVELTHPTPLLVAVTPRELAKKRRLSSANARPPR